MTVDLSVPPNRQPRFTNVRVHRRNLTRTTERDGVPVTPIPETILDLCAVSRNQSIPLRALDDVLRRRLASSFELERCLAEHGRGVAGISVYRTLLERRLGRTPPGTIVAEVEKALALRGGP